MQPTIGKGHNHMITQACPRCKGLLVTEIDTQFPTQLGITLDRCLNCGYIKYSPIPVSAVEEETAKLLKAFKKHAREYKSTITNRRIRWNLPYPN